MMKKYLLAALISFLSGTALFGQPSLVEVQTTDVSCNGGTDGTILIRITGGQPPYSYTIFRDADFQSSPEIMDTFYLFPAVSAKDWHIIVEDDNAQGFSEFSAAPVSQPDPVSISSETIIPISCSGSADGEIQVTATGESGNYNFELNPGGTVSSTGNFSSLDPGTYSVTVTDATGCSTSDVSGSLVLVDPSPVSIISESSADATCYGADNGTVSANATGGTPPYTYTLNPGAIRTNSTGVFSGVAPGTYTVEVTDVNNCASVSSTPVTVDEPDEMVITGAVTSDISCYGANDGSIVVSVSGGTPGYQYTLTPGNIVNTSGTFTGLSQGNYTVSVTDANLCGPVSTGSLSINEPDILSITDYSSVDISCNGTADGEVHVIATGGTVPLSYTLTPGGISNSSGDFLSLDEGSYTVSVNDANGCPSVNTPLLDVNDPSPVVITGQTYTAITCNGADDGTIMITASGGTGTLSYTLSPGSVSNTSGSFTSLEPGDYTVQVEDENACPPATAGTITIQEPSEITVDDETSTDISCAGFSDGSVTVTVSGGTPPYNYTLLPSGISNSTGDFTGLSAGDYSIEVTDASNCPVVVSNVLTVDAPEAITIESQIFQDISCNDAGDGEIHISATGGTAPLSYTLNPGSITKANGDFTSLDEGTYTVSVSDDNSCPAADSGPIEIKNPGAVTIIDQQSTDISCNGSEDGSITIIASGGTGELTYLLSPGGEINDTGNFTDLSAGSYTVTVEDENDCSAATSAPIVINEPSQISVSQDGSSVLSLNCFGESTGRIDISISGGTSPYTTEWTGPSGYTSSSEDISGLTAGTYTLSISDANSCSPESILEVEITEPSALTMDIATTDVTCAGDANGSITVSAAGGTPPYMYSRNGISYQMDNTFTGLTRNNYTIYTRDDNGCIISQNVMISEPDELSVASEIRIDNNRCYGDSLGEIRILEVNGGIRPYQYSIDGGITFSLDSVFTQLPAGSYQTVVKDDNGCTDTGNMNVINQPSQIKIINYTQTDVTGCYGNENGQIFIEASGGTGSKVYSLDSETPVSSGIFTGVTGGIHTISITDDNLCSKDTTVEISEPVPVVFTTVSVTDITTCNGDATGAVSFTASGGEGSFEYSIDDGTFSTSSNFSGLVAGPHLISVRDAGNCRKDSTININEPLPLSIESETSVNISCPGADDGEISLTAAGGTEPYEFSLNPGSIVNNDGIFTNLAPGTYTVEITDANNCGPVTASEFTFIDPEPVNADSVVTSEITCHSEDDAEIHIFLSGGTPPYAYSIDDGNNFSGSGDFIGLAPGTYYSVVEDANGCLSSIDTITFSEPPALVVETENKSDINTCFGEATGTITFEVSGGNPPIEYSIDEGITWQSSGNFTALLAGTYSVIAQDAEGCRISSALFTINQPDEITADIVTTPSLDEDNKGSITISNISGGTGTLEFSISGTAGPFSTETEYTHLDPDTYTVVIRDENGCTYEEDVIVSEYVPLDVTVIVAGNSCYGSDDASISLVANDPVGQVEYSIDDSISWSDNGLFENLQAGTYYIFARDEDDRYFQDTLVVEEPEQMNIFSNITPASCNAFSNDGAINITVNGATGNVDYEWSTGATTEDLDDIRAGKYRITAVDQNMCSVTDTIEVPAISIVNAEAGKDTAVCYGDELILSGQGGTTLSWSPAEGLSDPDIANPVVETTEDRTYILTASGSNECYDTDTIHITVYPRLGLDAGNDTSLVENQSLTITTSGGPYLDYHWAPVTGIDDSTSASPTINISETTTYIVSAETADGCIDRDTITITLVDKLTIYSAFSPNGDGVNDYWDIDYAELYPDITVEVFNRWGERLFSSKGYTDDKRWNGKYKGTDVPVGTYYYVVIPYSGADAVTGPVTIVR